MNSITNLTPKQLRRAADIQERIQSLQSELNDTLGTPAETSTESPKRRKFTAAARAKMRRAQKTKWAKIKGKPAKPAKKAKRKFSAAVRKARSLRMKAMWAAKKAQGKKSL